MIRSVNDTTRQGDKSDTSSVETNTARFGGTKGVRDNVQCKGYGTYVCVWCGKDARMYGDNARRHRKMRTIMRRSLVLESWWMLRTGRGSLW